MTEQQLDELEALVREYGVATLVERDDNRPRQIRRILDYVRNLSASIADTAGANLTADDVERQYQDGVHIGSGLPRATCPCGFCAKHRHGFNQGSEPQREMTANERWAHHPLIPLSAYSNAAPPAPSVADTAGAKPEGWKLVRVNEHFDSLIDALERAESKGYLPDAIAEEWANFACDENIAAPPAPSVADAAGARITYEQMEQQLSNDGYSRQADVIRQIIKHRESGE